MKQPNSSHLDTYPLPLKIATGAAVGICALVLAFGNKNSIDSDQSTLTCLDPIVASSELSTASQIMDKAVSQIPGEQPSKEVADQIGNITEGSKVTVCYTPKNVVEATVETYGNTRTYTSN